MSFLDIPLDFARNYLFGQAFYGITPYSSFS